MFATINRCSLSITKIDAAVLGVHIARGLLLICAELQQLPFHEHIEAGII